MNSPKPDSLRASICSETEKPAPEVADRASPLSEAKRNAEGMVGAQDEGGHISVLDVYIHQARDIHNICIYRKQDVYAKFCLTNDPDTNFSTSIINGGGMNPVFDEKLQLKVDNVDSSLKCEIWMLSRVRNYLEDQLLGFALVPLSDILGANGKLVQEFSLSSNDLFHSPAGFVELSLTYRGASPEIVNRSPPPVPLFKDVVHLSEEEKEDPAPSELTKIEFPDPNIVNENEIMVSEYLAIPCGELDSRSPERLIARAEGGNNLNSRAHNQGMEKSSHESLKEDPPVRSASTNVCNESPATVAFETELTPQSVSDVLADKLSEEANKCVENETRTNLLCDKTGNLFSQPLINIQIEPEQPVVQQDIVDIYMKSMQQFTDSLAKMKLPLDIDNESVTAVAANAVNTTNESENTPTDSMGRQKSNGSRVFYGSRAFF